MELRIFAKLSSFVACLVLLVSMTGGALAQSFTVSANPQALTAYPGQSNVPITVAVSSSTLTQPVNVTLSGLPTGITISPSSLSIMPGSTGTFSMNLALNADQEAFPAAAAGDKNSATNAVTVVGSVGAASSTSTFSLTVSLSNPSYTPPTNQINIPIVNINTNGVPIADGTTDVPGTITITSADGTTTYLPSTTNPDDTANFHWHGNTTTLMPKKPYHIKLNTSLDLLTVMGLKCPYVTSSGKAACDKSKSYVLLANYDDKTLLRDWTASALANAIPYGNGYIDETPVPSPNTGVIPTPSGTAVHMPWAPHSLFVEVFINGAYQGNYQLIEQVKVDSHRLNITELAETDVTDDITGGYLMEIDARKDSTFVFTTAQGLPIGLIDPDFTPDPDVPAQTQYISDYVKQAETALFSTTYTDPTSGWRAFYDEASAINFYLVNDLMGNVDGGEFFSSDYLYKAKDNPFIYMGPIWDFDISSGNVNYQPIENPTVPWMQTQAIWYKQWFTDAGFKADVITQFNALKNNGVLAKWIASVPQQAATLEQSQANNFARWPMLGEMVWPNPQAAGSYDGEVSYLTNFLNLRVAYLDSTFNGKATTTTTVSFPAGPYYLGAPITLASHVTGAQSPTGIVSFFSGGVVIGTATLDSNSSASLTTNALRLGSHTVQAVYNGDTTNALSASSSPTINVVPALVPTSAILSSAASSVAPGTAVSFYVSVVPNVGSATPTGTVTFKSNGVTLASVGLSGGAASYSNSSLATGNDSIQAVYSGDSVNSGSSSNLVTVTVTTAGTPILFSTSPTGASYTVDGNLYTAPQSISLVSGSTHTVATSTPQTSNGTQYTFTGWSDGGALSHTITVSSNTTHYTASFSVVYLLTTSASPSAGGTVTVNTASSNGYYAPGTVVGLTATPTSGYVFTGWTGSVASASSATTTVTMNAPQTVRANFAIASGGGINYSNGFSAGGMSINGNAALSGTNLQLTNGSKNQISSAFYTTAQGVASFTTDFTFQLTNPTADGMMFVLQNQGTTAIGGAGGELGYGSATAGAGIQTSVGVKFDLYSNSGEGANSTGLYTNGAQPIKPSTDLTPSGINLHSGHVFQVHMAYKGTTLTVTILDTVTSANATQTYTVNIPSIVGAPAALAGFTAASGGAGAVQNILTWTYTPGTPATVQVPIISPTGGTYFAPQQVKITDATAGAGIYYTLDNSTPTTSSTPYTGPITVSSSETITAIAALNGTVSGSASAAYTIGSSSGIDYSGGFTSGSLSINGNAALSGTKLRLTNGSKNQVSSTFYNTAVNVTSFTNDFTLQLTNPTADGMMFVIQNQGITAIGGAAGGDLGYGSPTAGAGIQKSVGIKFDLYSNSGEGPNSTGLYTNGADPIKPATDLTSSGVNLHSGHPLQVHMTYNGTTLTVVITDTVTAATATQSYKVNIPSVVGSTAAYVGFTGASGGAGAIQDVLTWKMTTP